MSESIHEQHQDGHEPAEHAIAIIGMACRFPGASTPEAFWHNLRAGVESVSFFADHELEVEIPGWLQSPDYVKARAILGDVDQFDASFFGYSAREAALMDPQQRLMLECAWEAIERAGYAPDQLPGRVGVFAGAGMNTYLTNNAHPGAGYFPNRTFLESAQDMQVLVGNDKDYIATRLSYKLNLTGPGVNVQTACSTSLVALHFACQSLLSGESDMALVGAAGIVVPEKSGYLYQPEMILSPDGHCRAFDAQAAGTVYGNGLGALLLKPLARALEDGDTVQAVVRGTAINNDGALKMSFTAPSIEGQAAVIAEALLLADVDADSIGYVETHGTGTALGDPVEIAGLTRAFRQNTDAAGFCAIGSVKTNIGHLSSAAGLAGLMKAVLAMQHGEIPPTLHFSAPNPRIDFASSPFYVNAALREWPRNGAPRRAGVSSFGIGGTNAHTILEEAPPVDVDPAAAELPGAQVLPLSARTPAALHELAQRYGAYLEQHPTVPLADLCYTASVGRTHFNQRLAVVGGSAEELRERLAALPASAASNGRATTPPVAGQVAGQVGFLFTGQGVQRAGMARELFATEPTFRAALEACDELLRPYLDESLLTALYPDGEAEAALMERMSYNQPAIFAVGYALALLWQSWGIRPDVVLGHSIGEYAAACIAGVFSLADAVKLVAARGRLMETIAEAGQMAAVFADEATVAAALALFNGQVEIAALNGPKQIVISGPGAAVEALRAEMAGRAIETRRLRVAQAFHSPLIDPILDEFEAVAAEVVYHEPQVAFISALTGQQVSGAELGQAHYWRRHMREPVRFGAAMQTALATGAHTFVELGPHPVLLGLGQLALPADADDPGIWLASLHNERPDRAQILESLGALYAAGAEVDWAHLFRGPRRRLPLPTYPFQRQRYWIDAPTLQVRSNGRAALRPLIGHMARSPLVRETLLETNLSTAALPFLRDHVVYDEVVVPGSCYLATLLSAAEVAFNTTACTLEDVVFPEGLALPEGTARTLQVVLTPEGGTPSAASFQLISFEGDEPPAIHATGRMVATAPPAQPIPIQAIRDRCPQELESRTIDAALAARAMVLGPAFLWLEGTVYHNDEEALCRVEQPMVIADVAGYQLHPGLIEACVHLSEAAGPMLGETALPFAIEEYRFYQRPGDRPVWAYARRTGDRAWNLQLLTEEGEMLADSVGYEVRTASRAALQRTRTDWLYELEWSAQEHPEQPAAPTPGSWLIFADQAGIGAQLAALLHEQGQQTVLVAAGTGWNNGHAGAASNGAVQLTIDPTVPQDFERLLAEPPASGTYQGIVYLWSADACPDPAAVPAQAAAHCASLLHLVQAVSHHEQPPRLWVATRSAQTVAEPVALQPQQAVIWGMLRVLAWEQPDLAWAGVDLDPAATAAEAAAALSTELRAASPETHIALRKTGRLVGRLERFQAGTKHPDAAYPMLANLHQQPATRREPGPGQVEVRVRAAGLNFWDVLTALGVIDEPAGDNMGIDTNLEVPFGLECAGEVVAVGEGVENIPVGTEALVLLTVGGLQPYVLARKEFVIPLPASMSPAEAATVPTTFLTAGYGLYNLAQLQPGERVLIHAGSGGVGQAAIQLALAVGAEVFATASPPKWAFLQAQGVHHILNSRTLDFADEIRELTGGQGVDVVLNSLSGEFIDTSFALLNQGGRFIEIGKRDIWTHEKARAVRPDVFYEYFSQGSLDPPILVELMEQLLQQFAAGTLRPLPMHVFPLRDAGSAFRYMQQARHIGKIVITRDTPEEVVIRPGVSYLVTGGLGGLGLKVAEHLVAEGARHLVLTGRNAPGATAHAALARMAEQGAQVLPLQGDVTSAADVTRMLAAAQGLAPLRGIIHAAGVLDDGVLVQQSAERFETVLGPKVQGAWHLHTQTQHMPLDWFVLFSSEASLLGSPGQGNHAAACAFLDGLAHHRRALGLPALSINWGAWSEVGQAAQVDASVQARWKSMGIGSISPAEGVQLLQTLLPQGVAQVGVLPMTWATYLGAVPDGLTPLVAGLAPRQAPAGGTAGATQEKTLHERIAAVAPAQGWKLLQSEVERQVAEVVGLDPARRIDPRTSFFELGMNSLLALDLSRRMRDAIGTRLPTTLVFDYPYIEQLVNYLGTDVLAIGQQAEPAEKAKPAPAASGGALAGPDPETIAELSEDELAEQLLRKISSIEEEYN